MAAAAVAAASAAAAAAESPGAGVLVAVIGICECANLVRCAYAWWLMNRVRRSSSVASSCDGGGDGVGSDYAPSLLSSYSATDAIEECWQNINYAEVYGDVWSSSGATAAAGVEASESPLSGTEPAPKCTLLELTERLQREPMADEIIEYVDIGMAADGVPVMDGRRVSYVVVWLLVCAIVGRVE